MTHEGYVDRFLQEEYQDHSALFEAQPPIVQRFLEAQADQLAAMILQRAPHARFDLPDRVVDKGGAMLPVPGPARQQTVGGWTRLLRRTSAGEVLRRHLAELAQSADPAVATSADLVRFATAMYMVHSILPAGRSVTYVPVEGEELPTLPVASDLEPESALTEATDAIAEQGDDAHGRGQFQIPFTPAARRFYLPQWVAYDDQGRLLVGTVEEAEAHVASMQHFVAVLHAAAALAPYVVADAVYQQKRYGMLGQLVNQGRALARYKTDQIVATIARRAAAQTLNRGLRLSLPYFDDQALEVKLREMQVIPAGRIMFVPALVVRAMREERAKVAQDTRLSPSTRSHLLSELAVIERAFTTPSSSSPA
ncbi:MAG: hypothetical protein JXD18_13325 [Anaerolineae bacterium]|nr:hypothetical protein [Anaerolineae bacterium]